MGCIKISAPHTAKARHGYTQYWARIILIYRTDACLHTLCKICKHAIFMNLNMYSYTTLVHLISYLFRYHFCIPITSLINTAYIKSQKKRKKEKFIALLHCCFIVVCNFFQFYIKIFAWHKINFWYTSHIPQVAICDTVEQLTLKSLFFISL